MSGIRRKRNRKCVISSKQNLVLVYVTITVIQYMTYRFLSKIRIPDDGRIPVFYNVYTDPESDGSLTKSIVDEQMKGISAHHNVFVRSIGQRIEIENTTLLRHDHKGDEMDTLALLYEHCVENPNGKVIYLHSKGSFHPNPNNDRYRRYVTRGALSDECAFLPDRCDICSSCFSPVPHPHTPGNMWLARCRYIKKLVNPIEFEKKMNDIYHDGHSIKGLPPDFEERVKASDFGLGRFAAEHWLHSHPNGVPCDLTSADYRYLFGYNNIPPQNFVLELGDGARHSKEIYAYEADPLRILQEYLALYNELPSSNWWGWKFYTIKY